MMDDLPRAFAEITCKLEDLHAIAIEGQSKHASPDMHRAMIGLIRSGITALEDRLVPMQAQIDRLDP